MKHIIRFAGIVLLLLAGCGRLNVEGEVMTATRLPPKDEPVWSTATLGAEATADLATPSTTLLVPNRNDNSISTSSAQLIPQSTPTQSVTCCGGDIGDLPNKVEYEATLGTVYPTSSVPVQMPTIPGSQRIEFQPGSITTVVTGQVQPQEIDEWIISVEAGQTLSVQLSFTLGEATLGISGADGSVVTVSEDHATHFTGVLPTTQDYYVIVLGAYDMPEDHTDYTLTVSLH